MIWLLISLQTVFAQNYDSLTMCQTGREAVRKICVDEMDQITIPPKVGEQGYAEAKKGVTQLKGLRLGLGSSDTYCREAYRKALEHCHDAENEAARQMDDDGSKKVRGTRREIEKDFKAGMQKLEDSLREIDRAIKTLESIIDHSAAGS